MYPGIPGVDNEHVSLIMSHSVNKTSCGSSSGFEVVDT